MSTRHHPSVISWRLGVASMPAQVAELLADDEGRPRFWADPTGEPGANLRAILAAGATWEATSFGDDPPYRFTVQYPSGGVTTCDVCDDGAGGSVVIVTDIGASAEDRTDVLAAWVSALSAIKATVDFTLDLFAYNQWHTWMPGYVVH